MDDLQFGDCGRAQAFDLTQPCGRRRYHLSERAECRDQILCQQFDVTPRNCAKQNELQELVVVDGLRAGVPKAGTQPAAMAVKMWRMRRDMCGRVFRHGTNLARKHGIAVSAERTSPEACPPAIRVLWALRTRRAHAPARK